MKSKAEDDFYHSGVNYCSLIENFDSNQEKSKLKSLLHSLLDLYSKALNLPDVEPENDTTPEVNLSLPQINFGLYENYWEVFNPYEFEEPLVASLSDDVLDIYKDVKKGMCYTKKINRTKPCGNGNLVYKYIGAVTLWMQYVHYIQRIFRILINLPYSTRCFCFTTKRPFMQYYFIIFLQLNGV
jgi:hypothetical protein